ncbi:hypothetical protein AB0876_02050 [Mycobacterium sp. NPDC049093]
MSTATPEELQARIRRWSRIQNLAGTMALVGIALPFVTFGIALLVQQVTGDDSVFPVLIWMIWVGIALLVVGAFLETEAQDRVREARFAAGYKSAGMVEFRNEEPSTDIGGFDTFTLVISAEMPGQEKLHRRLCSQDYPADADVHVGQVVVFLHTNHDPDDLDDIQFVRFAGGRKKQA